MSYNDVPSADAIARVQADLVGTFVRTFERHFPLLHRFKGEMDSLKQQLKESEAIRQAAEHQATDLSMRLEETERKREEEEATLREKISASDKKLQEICLLQESNQRQIQDLKARLQDMDKKHTEAILRRTESSTPATALDITNQLNGFHRPKCNGDNPSFDARPHSLADNPRERGLDLHHFLPVEQEISTQDICSSGWEISKFHTRLNTGPEYETQGQPLLHLGTILSSNASSTPAEVVYFASDRPSGASAPSWEILSSTYGAHTLDNSPETLCKPKLDLSNTEDHQPVPLEGDGAEGLGMIRLTTAQDSLRDAAEGVHNASCVKDGAEPSISEIVVKHPYEIAQKALGDDGFSVTKCKIDTHDAKYASTQRPERRFIWDFLKTLEGRSHCTLVQMALLECYPNLVQDGAEDKWKDSWRLITISTELKWTDVKKVLDVLFPPGHPDP